MSRLLVQTVIHRAVLTDVEADVPTWLAARWKGLALLRSEALPDPPPIADRDFRPVAVAVLRELLHDAVRHPPEWEPFAGSAEQHLRVLLEIPHDRLAQIRCIGIEASVPPKETP